MKNFFKLNWLTPKKALIATAVVFGLLLITQGEPFVRSDGFCYYTIDKSIIDQNSFISSTKPEYFDYMGHVKEVYNDKYISVCSPGAALFNLPGQIIANLFKGDRNVNNDYFIAYNGHTIFEGIAFLITAMTIGISALVLIYKTLRNLNFSEKLSIVSTGLTFISSYALWYIFLMPTYTHIYEIFAVALTLFGFTKYLNNQKDKFAPFIIGAGIGSMILTRPVLIPIALIIIGFMVYKKDLRNLIKTGLAGLPFALIYCVYNLVSYGKLITSGYSDVRAENFQFTQFYGVEVLFSPIRGLLVYSPLFIISFIGLVWLARKSRILSILGVVSLLAVATIYGLWPSWWGGGSYGSRFMMFFVPIAAIGLAMFIKYIKDNHRRLLKKSLVLILILTLFSTSLLVLYRFTTFKDKFYTPIDFYSIQLENLQQSGGVGEYVKSLPSRIPEGSGILALLTGISDYVVTVQPTRVTETATTLKLQMFAPPKSTQKLPNFILFYLVNKDTDRVQRVEITNLQPGQSITLICSTSCASQNSQFRIKATVTDIQTLPASEWEGINVEDFNFFFKKGENIQYRGNMIPWKIEEPYFNIII